MKYENGILHTLLLRGATTRHMAESEKECGRVEKESLLLLGELERYIVVVGCTVVP